MKEKPLLTKGLQMGGRAAAADYITQKLATGISVPYNFIRTAQLGAYGHFVQGPLGHFYGKRLEKAYPGTSEEAVIAKTLTTNAIYTPITNAVLLFVSGFAGNNAEDDKRRAERRQKKRQLLGLDSDEEVSDDEDEEDHPSLSKRVNNGVTRVRSKWKASYEKGLSTNVPLDYITFKYIPSDYKMMFKIFTGLTNTTMTAWDAKKKETEMKRRKRKAEIASKASASGIKVEVSDSPCKRHGRK